MSKYGSYSYSSDLTRQERREIGEFCLDYCIHNIGLPRHKRIPKFSITKGKGDGTYGLYFSDTKTICVYYTECKSVGDIVDTFIHEYIHHIQNLRSYNTLLREYGYRNHPLEVEAVRIAKEHRRKCLEQFRKFKMSSYE